MKSDCQHSFGCSAANRRYDDLGRLAGVRDTAPARVRIRWIVARDTVTWWWCCRCQPIVSAPASSPASVSCLRSAQDQLDRLGRGRPR